MRKLLFVCTAAGSVALLSGCATSGAMSKGDKQFARGQYELAIPLYKADVAKGKAAAISNFRIGEAYRLSNRIEESEPFYKAALDGGVKNADAGFRYAEALKANGKYDEAAAQFASYASSGGNRTLAARAETESKNAAASKAVASIKNKYDVMPVDALNSASSDFGGTMMAGTGDFVFASGREGKKYLGNGENFNDLYAIKFDNAAAMTGGTVRKLEGPFNTENKHEASATYTPDGKTMVFARSNDGSKKGYLSVDLWISYLKAGAWSEPVLANINDRTADDFAPAFAPDGTTLYFASGRKGGQGGNDLYKATLGPNGRFSPAENLGESINTAGNDNFPGVAPDGTLYFASDGRPGLGKLDLFMVKNGQPVNLGADVNSTADDFAPVPMAGDMGLFSSNRAGGKGSDDEYMFKKKPLKLVTFYADGTVLEHDDKAKTTLPVAGATVTVTGANGQRQTATSGPDGKFSLKLDSVSSYNLLAERAGDFSSRATLSTVGRKPSQDQLPNLTNDIQLPVTLTLNKIILAKAIEVKDILYDYNKYDIRPDAAIRLDTLVQTLVDNPKISIELSSHTDQRGKDAYNLKLSQQRAQAAVDYIVSKGISKSRITAKGYGETRPIVLKPTTEEEYQRNRRTEFKVTRIAK
ncbi:OmpA family protein [Hymenobacter negativus]|uniref:PD40 domain-containing protein n=1 Tax=Hymenobacter negativus TaxID=2795026 RepID=A0ABS0QC19_9BACT|nr:MULTISPECIES: OmpA family protein [Bacteria]MBH8560210.1 PD40 domain-containing protein [Hymenobacter negativus]MBH8570508.1 PD40 domain-containing protein [Hymenobacter negativus]MBR7210247.1 PD40 domain-containing protein [Microvirga sp. STS02]